MRGGIIVHPCADSDAQLRPGLAPAMMVQVVYHRLLPRSPHCQLRWRFVFVMAQRAPFKRVLANSTTCVARDIVRHGVFELLPQDYSLSLVGCPNHS